MWSVSLSDKPVSDWSWIRSGLSSLWNSPLFTPVQFDWQLWGHVTCVSVPGVGVQVAVHSSVPLTAADHCTWVLWEAGALSRSRWLCHAYIITTSQSEQMGRYFTWHLLYILTVCNEIDQWPSPVPGLTLNLPVMGVVLQVRGGGVVILRRGLVDRWEEGRLPPENIWFSDKIKTEGEKSTTTPRMHFTV